MGKNNNIIEIDGTKYDARTGAVLGPSTAAATKKPSKAKQMDSAVKKPTMSDVVRRPAKHAPSHAPATSHTLMRQSVKKPVPQPRKHTKAQGSVIAVSPVAASSIAPKKSVYNISDKRLKKAQKVIQSNLITHFAPVTSDSNTFSRLVQASGPKPPAGRSVEPITRPVGSPNTKPQTTSELLETALRQATSHEQKPVHPKRSHKLKKRAGLASASVLALALIVLAGSQQVSNVRVHMASAKAGFNVTLPDYRPAGYSLGKLDYSSGIASTTFKSNSDSRAYTITQKPSAWDSQALRDGFVIPRDKHYQTFDAAGRTVYIYGNHNATWVNAGIWYSVQSDGSLSDHQLVELASSL